MKLLVAGASGFLGKNFLLRAPRRWRVVGIYHNDATFPAFLRKHRLSHVAPARCDLARGGDVARLFRRHPNPYDACLYMAGNSDIARSVEHPAEDGAANIVGLLNFLEGYRGRRLVFLSSGTVYLGHRGPTARARDLQPGVPYGVSKLAGELYVKCFQQRGHLREYVILRFFGAFGPYEKPNKIYTRLLRHMERSPEEPFVLRGDGRNLIDAMPVSEAVDGLLRSLTGRAANVTVDFCRGTPRTVNQLVADAGRVFGRRLAVAHRGASPEYVTFRGSPKSMGRLFGFRPSMSLGDGLKELSAGLGHGS